MTARYSVALGLIAGASLFAWYNLANIVERDRQTAMLVNLSGKQRMLSQQIALFTSQLALPKTDAARQAIQSSLADSIDEISKNHNALTNRPVTLGLTSQHSPAIESLYYDGDFPLDARIADYISAAQRVLVESSQGIRPDHPDFVYILTEAPQALLSKLDAVVLQHQREGEEAVDQIKRIEGLVVILTLGLLVLEALIIFRPMASQMRSMLATLLTERTNAQKAAQAFRSIVQISPHGMGMIDYDGRWVMVNQELGRLLGCGKELQSLREDMRFDDVGCDIIDKHALDQIAKGRSSIERYEIKYVPRSGEAKWLDVSLSSDKLGFDSAGRCVVQVVDLTERRTVESRLRNTNRLEAVGQVAAGIAHEFNNRLAAISGNLQLLDTASLSNDRSRRRVRSAVDQIAECAVLIKRLMAYAGNQALKPDVLGIGAFLSEVKTEIDGLLNEKIGFSMTIEDDIWSVVADKSELVNVIRDLVLNARKAMLNGGDLEITARNVIVRQDTTLKDGNYVALSICDTGEGIPDQIREKVTQPFYKAGSVGVGLGLSMADGYMRQIGGKLTIENRLSGGAVIQLLLPCATGPLQTQSIAVSGGSALAGQEEEVRI